MKLKNYSIFLIRHGNIHTRKDADGNVLLYGSEVELTEEGTKQIRSLGDRIVRAGVIPTILVTSPLKRALETTAILRKVFDAKVIEDTRFGEWPAPELIGHITLPDIISRIWKPEKDEEKRQASETMKNTLSAARYYAHIYPKDVIGYVSHGDSLRLMLHGLVYGEKSKVPPMGILFRSNYLDKGEAWKITVSRAFRVRKKEYIGRPLKLWGRGERIS